MARVAVVVAAGSLLGIVTAAVLTELAIEWFDGADIPW